MKTNYAQILFIALFVIASSVVQAQTDDQPTSLAETAEPRITSFRDWTLQCLPGDTATLEICAMVHQVLIKSGKRLLAMQITETGAVGGDESPALVAVLSLPLGVYLPTGVSLAIDDRPPLKLEFERCDRGGCYAGLVMGEALTAALKAGSESVVRFNNLDGRTISAKLSLKGFTAAYGALIKTLEG